MKDLLDQFVDAMGLTINFSKSTLVPMHVSDSDLSADPKCSGLPRPGISPDLSRSSPLRAQAQASGLHSSLIAKVDKYLSG
jgi:hypothetical protein